MKNLIITLILFSGLNAIAQIEFGQMAYGGVGCPAGSLPQLEINQTQAKLLLDLNIEGRSQSALLQRKNCSIRLPVRIARGYQIKVNTRSVLGFISQEKTARTTVTARVGFVGAPSTKPLKEDWTSPITTDYTLDGSLNVNQRWSGCSGQDVMLTIDVAASNLRREILQEAFVSISELNFDFNFRRCK